MGDWFKDNKTLAYGIGAVVALIVVSIILAKFWIYVIVATLCIGVGYYFGRRHKKESNAKAYKNEERTGFL